MAQLTDEQRDGIREALLAQEKTGESITSIADRFGVSKTTVSRAAKALDVRPALRSMTKNATEARRSDLAARRAVLSERFVTAAERAMDDMEAPATIYNFGGKDNTYNEKRVPRPPTGDQRNLAIIAATMFDKHKVADQYDAQQGLASAVDDWLLDKLGVKRGDASKEGA